MTWWTFVLVLKGGDEVKALQGSRPSAVKTFEHEWIFDAPAEHRTFFSRRMFGGLAVYVFERQMLVLVQVGPLEMARRAGLHRLRTSRVPGGGCQRRERRVPPERRSPGYARRSRIARAR
jgi:hypothetical protein